MLISWVLLGIFVICTVFSPIAGTGGAAGAAVLEGAEQAVSFAMSIAGGICLWSGVMELMERCGIAAALSRALHPILRRLFPKAAAEPEILSALSENVSANLLGLGNAATPAGVRAAQGMARGQRERRALHAGGFEHRLHPAAAFDHCFGALRRRGGLGL